ncbi:Triphosphoribosyl-dephospho-CoA synthetase [hydrothermal vent metagenome]|uniref:Triphosphoribosyl-dephospho-CoA synthetase n=1 Tax=hydrothermal vent metagenome TaxID=652676 RepID=A0A3B1E7E2_9ZZZZ
MEATAPKVGNVHPGASFDDMTYENFVQSAYAVAPVLSQVQSDSIGKTILESVRATNEKVQCNTNLGIVLLLAPLVAVPASIPLKEGCKNLLQKLTLEDAKHVYEAIRIANPGGMGENDKGDIQQHPTGTLLEMMQLAATHDQIAAQYVNGYADLFEFGLTCLEDVQDFTKNIEENIVWLQLRFLERYSDSHIIRKCGKETGKKVQQRAAEILASGFPRSSQSQKLLREFDNWLRQENNIRNPGTTADLITATLFIALREGLLEIP